MILGTLFLISLYLILRYTLAWISYYNNLDSRLGNSTWRFTYDYPVVGERDISDLDDKEFVRLRRKKNKIILYLLLRYILAWITFYNNLDARLGDSTWRFSYDYPVIGERDISDLDDKNFVRLRRKKNKIVLIMYSIVLIMFIASMSVLSKFLLFFFD